MRTFMLLLAAIAAAQPFSTAGAAGTPDERAAAYHDFREAFDKGDYKTALPIADRVLELTRNQFDEDAPEVASALTNLATTYYRMRAYGDALDKYREAINVLELQNDAADMRLVRPLQGLGSALLAMHREEEAIVPLKRAVDIVRNRGGLLSEQQLAPLKTLIAVYETTGLSADASREQDYAFSVAESAYGKNDARMLGPINDLALWYEKSGRYTAARVLHTRAVQIADSTDPSGLSAIPGLRGIARCFRLNHSYGEPDELLSAADSTAGDPRMGSMGRDVVDASSVDGERALRSALTRLGDAPERAALRGAVLVDLGDWYLIAKMQSRALESWGKAWKDLAAAGDTHLLDQPTAIVYLPPSVASSQRQRDPENYAEQPVKIRLAIDATGSVRDATVANPAPARESAEKAVQAALQRSIWRPAFRNGEAIAVNDYMFSENVYVKLPKTAE
jgi:tetratricopeptide (TPR) repeat protein